MGALFSFLGGSAFRMIWGELSSYFTKKQDHQIELEKMKLQGELEAAAQARNLEAIKVQAALGVQTIRVQGEEKVNELETQAWLSAVQNATAPTGTHWLDVVRGLVQPVLAYIAIIIWVLALNSQGWTISEWDKELVSAIFGVYLANRHLYHRGK